MLCLFCIFFFFFKQKTAYEMRISDWSSDVCSSDLFEVDGDGGVVVFAAGPEVLLRGMPRPVAEQRREELAELGFFAWRRRAMEQIGRASCRERVCQYV